MRWPRLDRTFLRMTSHEVSDSQRTPNYVGTRAEWGDDHRLPIEATATQAAAAAA